MRLRLPHFLVADERLRWLLQSVKAIRDFFTTRQIELSDFELDQNLARDADDATTKVDISKPRCEVVCYAGAETSTP